MTKTPRPAPAGHDMPDPARRISAALKDEQRKGADQAEDRDLPQAVLALNDALLALFRAGDCLKHDAQLHGADLSNLHGRLADIRKLADILDIMALGKPGGSA